MATKLEDFCGKWKLARSENFEEFLQHMGVNFMIRKMATKASPVVVIELGSEQVLKMVMETGFMKRESIVDISGNQYEQDNQGTKSLVTAKFEDGKIVEDAKVQNNPKVKDQVITREILDGELVQTLNVGEGLVICKRIFKRV